MCPFQEIRLPQRPNANAWEYIMFYTLYTHNSVGNESSNEIEDSINS